MLHDFTWMEKYEEALSDEHPHNEKKKKWFKMKFASADFRNLAEKYYVCKTIKRGETVSKAKIHN